MPKRLTTKEHLARLGTLAQQPLTAERLQELRQALASVNNLIVAKAAHVTVQCESADLIPELVAAYGRFMEKPEKTDKGCLAKTAIVEALDALRYWERDLFAQGVRHVQLESAYGGQTDTAAELRSRCALALARLEDDQVFFELTALLADQESQPRIAAIRALAYLSSEKSELLLRLKSLIGDPEPQVLSECFAGLMQIAPERSLPFVAGFLTSADPLIAEGAALALGESRQVAAFYLLRRHWDESIAPDFKRMLLFPMALTRCEDAVEFLLDVARNEHQEYAAAAVKALKVYAEQESLRDKLYQAVVGRNERKVSEVYAREFKREPS